MQEKRQEIEQKILHLFVHKDPLSKGIPQAYALHFTCLSRNETPGIIIWSEAFTFLCSIGASKIVQMHPLETTGWSGLGWGMQSHGIKKQFEHEITPQGLEATQGGRYNLTFLGNWYSHFPVDLNLWDRLLGYVSLTMVVITAHCPYSHKAHICTWTFPWKQAWVSLAFGSIVFHRVSVWTLCLNSSPGLHSAQAETRVIIIRVNTNRIAVTTCQVLF